MCSKSFTEGLEIISQLLQNCTYTFSDLYNSHIHNTFK